MHSHGNSFYDWNDNSRNYCIGNNNWDCSLYDKNTGTTFYWPGSIGHTCGGCDLRLYQIEGKITIIQIFPPK